MNLIFKIHYQTKEKEKLQISIFGGKKGELHYTMNSSGNGIWSCEVDHYDKTIQYQYSVVNTQGKKQRVEGGLHQLNFPHQYQEFLILDEWNEKKFPENYLNNKVFDIAKRSFEPKKITILKKHTHLFRIEAPLYHPDWQLALVGSTPTLGNWNLEDPLLLSETSKGIWEIALTIPEYQIIEYKYALFHKKEKKIINLEKGDNRKTLPNSKAEVLQICADHCYHFQIEQLYHAAGVAIPVFSLRSENSFGVGAFLDLIPLGNWAQQCHLSMIQILPINDTTAHYTWEDSYPYAAVSVYALHPQYIALEQLDFPIPTELKSKYDEAKTELNALENIEYEKMISAKWNFLQGIFEENKIEILKDKSFKQFIKQNSFWLLPYVAFCVLRDQNKTPNFSEWKTHKKYIAGKIAVFFSEKNKNYHQSMLHAWVQYQLHKQLSLAVEHLHLLGISLKGDLPIGIFKHSVEAWAEPDLFGMNYQAGAPPDMFTKLGQNWEFPTYEWEIMKKNNYHWWKNRFKALEHYFDAMRIDHILGFFRIWRIPTSATQGIMGYFYPSIPFEKEELSATGLSFNDNRYCQPYINKEILTYYFGDKINMALPYLEEIKPNLFQFKPEYNTQRKIVEFCRKTKNEWVEPLLALSSNVLFLKEERNNKTVYYPRFFLEETPSFAFLNTEEQSILKKLYHHYFFERQEALWKESAVEKLPVILSSSRMLICGEDLGLVPKSVPEVMHQLAIVALKVQRMPAEDIPFYNPKNADYLNVVTASSHDSSTLRQWWKEQPALTQKYYNEQLQQEGMAPKELNANLVEIILKQHLYNDAMLAIFPLQDILATDDVLKNPNQEIERINNPANFPHYWQYRMHISLEKLNKEYEFNNKIKEWVENSGRYFG